MPTTLVFWLLFLACTGAFAAQVASRVRLIAAAPEPFSFDDPAPGSAASARCAPAAADNPRAAGGRRGACLVFWGFVAFAGYTPSNFCAASGSPT